MVFLSLFYEVCSIIDIDQISEWKRGSHGDGGGAETLHPALGSALGDEVPEGTRGGSEQREKQDKTLISVVPQLLWPRWGLFWMQALWEV